MSKIASLTWNDEAGARLGPGVSRAADGASTRPFRVRVRLSRGTPMVVTLQAETKARALRYAQNRWPDSTVELIV